MIPADVTKLGLNAQKTNVGAQKIDGSLLETYGIVSASFLLQDNLGKVQFFEETFLLANISIEVILGMLFLFLGNADVKFTELKKLTQKSYTTAEVLPTTSWVELIDKREFAKATLDDNSETFVIHVSILEATTIHLFQAAQIAVLYWNKARTKILAKYSDYTDVFSINQVMEYPKNTSINEHTIELVKEKQLSYKPIYALNLIELETLNAYIKTHLKTRFI